MRIQVAVWDPLPLYRRGVMAIRSDLGLFVDCPQEPEDVVAWSAGQDKHVALITVDSSSSDRGWNAIARLKGLESELVVVALLADDTLDSYVRAGTFPRESRSPSWPRRSAIPNGRCTGC